MQLCIIRKPLIAIIYLVDTHLPIEPFQDLKKIVKYFWEITVELLHDKLDIFYNSNLKQVSILSLYFKEMYK